MMDPKFTFDYTINFGNLITLVVLAYPLVKIAFSIKPTLDSHAQAIADEKLWRKEHETWAEEEVKTHAKLETAMATMAQAHTDAIGWLEKVDARIVRHLESTSWDGRTERRSR